MRVKGRRFVLILSIRDCFIDMLSFLIRPCDSTIVTASSNIFLIDFSRILALWTITKSQSLCEQVDVDAVYHGTTVTNYRYTTSRYKRLNWIRSFFEICLHRNPGNIIFLGKY